MEEKHIYDVVPDTQAPPLPLPRLLQQNVAYSSSLPEHLTISTTDDVTPDKPHVIHGNLSPDALKMTINMAYDAAETPDKQASV